MELSAWSSRSSCFFPVSRRRPQGSELYTPIILLPEFWISWSCCSRYENLISSHRASLASWRWILYLYIFDWFWDVDPLCIAHGYTLYSYMTWICILFDWEPWFSSSRAWVCPLRRDNCFFTDGTSQTLVSGSLDFIHWWRYCNLFQPLVYLLTSHISEHLLYP